MSDVTKQAISWQKINNDSQKLSQAILDQNMLDDCKGIIAVARGGLLVSQLVANYLDIRRVESISVIGYDGMAQRDAQEFNGTPSPDIGDGGSWIVVDDLVDTGRSYRFIKEHFPNAKYVALYAKPAGKADAVITVEDFAQDTWIDFPWEVTSLVS